jgi:hypothetical protein
MATDGCGHDIVCDACPFNQSCGVVAPQQCDFPASCTGLCRQQVACSGGGTTRVTGTVYAPQGADPLPNVLVYVPNAALTPFTPGVQCGTCSTQVSGQPLVSATTDAAGNFTLTNMPVGTNIPLVIQAGRWRRQFTIPSVAECVTTPLPSAGPQQLRFPRNKAEGEMPLMVMVTGSSDAPECLLRKIGIADAEFTPPTGNGRVRVFRGDGATPGATLPAATPSAAQLWSSQAVLNSFDMVILGCQGAEVLRNASTQQRMVTYANAGGRVFANHFGREWFNSAPFSDVATWHPGSLSGFASDPQVGFIDRDFAGGEVLAQWLVHVGASTTPGEVMIETLRDDFDTVVPPTRSWLHVDDPFYGQKTMQFTFNTPVGLPEAQQCGRVLYYDHHANNLSLPPGVFPTECTAGPMTPQEKLLEFSFFDLGACIGLLPPP